MGKYYRLKLVNNMTNDEIDVSSIDDIKKIDMSYISLSGCIDYCLIAKQEFKDIKNKEIEYHVILSESIKIDGFDNLFDCLKIIKNDRSINSLEFILSSKVNEEDFKKLIDYIKNTEHYFYIDFKLGNTEVFNNKQLEILKEINEKNENVDMFLNINQSYEGNHIENNEHDNTYEFDEFILVKEKINKIIDKIPPNYTDIEKVLFVYKYLGKKVKYDYETAKIKTVVERKKHDRNSLYYVLFKNKGVCSDIATTFRIIMKAIGIECKTVSSCGHEWNVVKINGKWYHVDLTWDIDNIKNNNNLKYFLKSESFILKDDSHQFYTWYADKEDIAKRSIIYTKYQK